MPLRLCALHLWNVVWLSFFAWSPVIGDTIYVDVDAKTGGDGTTWETAFDDLHDGLAAAVGGGEVWVAEGTYSAFAAGHRFQIPSGAAVYGGFAGTETSVDQRDWTTHRTILTSGNVGIVDVYQTTADTLLDGLNMENAGDGFPNDWGMGIKIRQSSLTIRHCRVFGNSGRAGGGVGIDNGGTDHEVRFIDCRIEQNRTTNTADAMCPGATAGGGISVSGKATFIGCQIINNHAAYPSQPGGGIYARNADLTLINCVIADNRAGEGCSAGGWDGGDGGGIYGNGLNTLEMYGCLVTGNSVGLGGGDSGRPGVGGGVYASGSSLAINITNCTIARNYGVAIQLSTPVPIVIDSSIVWNDELSGVNPGEVTHSNVQSTQPDPTYGNISEDPQFVDIANRDYRLTAGSPSVDAGGTTSFPLGVDFDLDGHPRFIDDPFTPNTGAGEPPVDMGAYELILGDVQDDGDVDLFDFAGWGGCVTGSDGGPYVEGCRSFDFDGDLDVDLIDFAGLQLAFTGMR